jgi:hypothetical protein
VLPCGILKRIEHGQRNDLLTVVRLLSSIALEVVVVLSLAKRSCHRLGARNVVAPIGFRRGRALLVACRKHKVLTELHDPEIHVRIVYL